MAETELLYLSQADVRAVGMTMKEVIAVLEQAFREKGEGRVEMPPKPGVHPAPEAFIHAMPAYIPAMKAVGMKWISGFPHNRQRGLPYFTGLIVMNDVETGVPLCVLDCEWITAYRTGAASALSAKYLARSDSHSIGILGCGVQGWSNLNAMHALFPLTNVVAYDIHPEQAERYARRAQDELGLQAVAAASPRQAVAGCDIVVTAGTLSRPPHRTIQPGWLEQGAFAAAVDVDSYWHPDALRQCDKFCTDDLVGLAAFRQEGHLQDIPPIYAELGELVVGKKPGRTSPRERNIACNLGIAMDDVAVGAIVYQRAAERGIGRRLPL